MKRISLLSLCLAISLALQAQHITHRFVNTSMPDALSWLDHKNSDISINFIYDELEDFKVTADIKNKSISEAIQALIGFYPIRATYTETKGDGITLPKDYHHTYISVECTQKTTFHYKGMVCDNHNQPLPFANIILLNAKDSTYLNGGVSNESGTFVVPCDAKKVIARISYVGFKTLSKICMNGTIGTVQLQPLTNNLKAVVVKGEKPFVAYQGDRLVADIKGSLLAKGNDGESLLRQLPGVWAEKGSVSINGNNGTKIYIGDRQVQLSGENLSTYLKGIRSETIDKIEIIAHPSAEYEAEGQGGIIRILLKSAEHGTELNLSSNFGLSKWYQVAPSTSFSYHNDKLGIQVSGNGKAWSRGESNSVNHVELIDQGIIYDTPAQKTSRLQDANINLSISYDFNAKNHLLLDGNLTQDWGHNKNKASTFISPSSIEEAGINGQTDMLLKQNTHNKQFAISANYIHQFDREGNRNLKLMADLVRQYSYGNDQQYQYINYDAQGNELSREFCGQNAISEYKIISGEARYTYNTPHSGQWMWGSKISFTDMGNGLDYYDELGMPISSQGYSYGYTEYLGAAYQKYQISKHSWDLTIGLREEVEFHGAIEEKKRNKDWPYSKLDFTPRIDIFPSIYFTKRFGEQHALSFSYSRRTQRISYRNLLPQRYHESKYEIVESNPTLRPDYPNELSFTYTLKRKYMLGAEYTWSNNGFNADIQSTVEDGTPTYISTYRDGMRSRKLYLYLYAPIRISSWWSMNLRPWMSMSREAIDEVHTKSSCGGIVATQSFVLPGDARFTLLYIAKTDIKNGNYEELANNNLHATLTKSFAKDRWTASLAAYNLFYKNSFKMRYTMKDVHQTRKIVSNCPTVSLNINYNIQWGKQKRNASIEHSNNEERGRL